VERIGAAMWSYYERKLGPGVIAEPPKGGVGMRKGPRKQKPSISRRRFLAHADLTAASAAAGGAPGAVRDLLAAQAAPQTQPKRGGTLTISQSVDINTLHPWVGNLNVWKVTKTGIYDQLSYQDPVTFQVKPKLAKSFVWTDNNTSLVIALPGGVTFH